MNTEQRDEALTLGVLAAVEDASDLTQRGLADRLDVALGLAHSYLRRCVRKGLVKIKTAPANRYAYYLTPKGFAEKSRLTARYLSYSLGFYRTAAESYADLCRLAEARAWRRVLLCGLSELAEIASLKARELELEIVGSFEPGATVTRFIAAPVWPAMRAVPACEVALLTALQHAPEVYAAAVERFGPERVLVPHLLAPSLRSRPAAGAARGARS